MKPRLASEASASEMLSVIIFYKSDQGGHICKVYLEENKVSGHIGERNRKGTGPRLIVTLVRRDDGGWVSTETCSGWCVLKESTGRILFSTVKYKEKLSLDPRETTAVTSVLCVPTNLRQQRFQPLSPNVDPQRE